MSTKHRIGNWLLVIGINRHSFGIGFSIDKSLIFVELGFIYFGLEL